MKYFPGATSKELLHDEDPTSKDAIYSTAVIHVGVCNLLNNNASRNQEKFFENLSTECAFRTLGSKVLRYNSPYQIEVIF